MLLAMLLQKSARESGLSDIDSGTHLRPGITTSLALILGLLAVSLRSVDFELRTLAPYQLMRGYIGSKAPLSLDLLNRTIPRNIQHEITSLSCYNLAATTTTLLASLFTIFLAPIFQEAIISEVSTIQLLNVESSYDYRYDATAAQPNYLAASLILRNNFSYTKFIYENLAFTATAFEIPADHVETPALKTIVSV